MSDALDFQYGAKSGQRVVYLVSPQGNIVVLVGKWCRRLGPGGRPLAFEHMPEE